MGPTGREERVRPGLKGGWKLKRLMEDSKGVAHEGISKGWKGVFFYFTPTMCWAFHKHKHLVATASQGIRCFHFLFLGKINSVPSEGQDYITIWGKARI